MGHRTLYGGYIYVPHHHPCISQLKSFLFVHIKAMKEGKSSASLAGNARSAHCSTLSKTKPVVSKMQEGADTAIPPGVCLLLFASAAATLFCSPYITLSHLFSSFPCPHFSIYLQSPCWLPFGKLHPQLQSLLERASHEICLHPRNLTTQSPCAVRANCCKNKLHAKQGNQGLKFKPPFFVLHST